MHRQSFKALCIAGIAAIFAAGCHSAEEPAPVWGEASLLYARIPASVAPETSFRVVAYFGRGYCDESEPVTEVTSYEASIGMRIRRLPIPAGTGCPDILVADSVVVTVAPPIALPYTVFLRRAKSPDSVAVVRALEPAG